MNNKERKKIILEESGLKLELCSDNFYYCPVHGKCPAILEKEVHGQEVVKTGIGFQALFFCEKCGMIKTINVYGNCTGFSAAKRMTSFDENDNRPLDEFKRADKLLKE